LAGGNNSGGGSSQDGRAKGDGHSPIFLSLPTFGNGPAPLWADGYGQDGIPELWQGLHQRGRFVPSHGYTPPKGLRPSSANGLQLRQPTCPRGGGIDLRPAQPLTLFCGLPHNFLPAFLPPRSRFQHGALCQQGSNARRPQLGNLAEHLVKPLPFDHRQAQMQKNGQFPRQRLHLAHNLGSLGLPTGRPQLA